MKKALLLYLALAVAVLTGFMSCSPRNLSSQKGLTSVMVDGIEYKYQNPTKTQLKQWARQYGGLCAQKLGSLAQGTGLSIPEKMVEEHPALVYLVLKSRSIADKKEKQDWFDMYYMMNDKQINKLYSILYRETYTIEAIQQANQLNQDAYKYANAGDFNAAHQTIDKAIALRPQTANYLDSKGEFYLMEGKIDKALSMWKKVVKLDPDFLSKLRSGSALYDGLVKLGKIK